MGHMLHARARTTPEVRREIQNSQESLMTLAQRYGVNIKTIAKWRKRNFIHDAPMGPKFVHSKSLTEIEEAVVVAFRVFTQLPLDDCLHCIVVCKDMACRNYLRKNSSLKRKNSNPIPLDTSMLI